MGGLGSGRRSDREPRRLVESCFILDVREILATRLKPGTYREFQITAPLIAWPVHALLLVRSVEGPVATIWFDPLVGGGLAHLAVEVPPRGSSRPRYLRCPRPNHPVDQPRLAAKLYWPVGDPGGFACRGCHRLTYRSQRERRERPLWLRRRIIEAAQWRTEQTRNEVLPPRGRGGRLSGPDSRRDRERLSAAGSFAGRQGRLTAGEGRIDGRSSAHGPASPAPPP